MRIHAITTVAAIALLSATANAQQAPQGQGAQGQMSQGQMSQMMRGQRVAGTVKSVSASSVTVTTATGDVDVALTPQTKVLVRETGNIGDIKTGSYLGTSNKDGTEAGTGTATEVHMMDDGPNANAPMGGPGMTMTNGHVKTVKSTGEGKEIDIDYGQSGATRHVVVGKDTPVTMMKDVGVAGLKPGTTVNAMTAPGADGKTAATYISITPPAAK